MTKKTLFICLCSIACGTQAFGAETAQFLKIGVGARPVAMGNSLASVADDLNALTYNPAGLAQMEDRQASFTHAQLFEDVRLDHLGYAHPLGFIGPAHAATLGLSVTYLTQGGIAGRDANRQATGNIAASDISVQAGVGANLSPSLRMGTSVRVIRSRLASSNANTVALDWGSQWHQGAFEVGAAVRNIGPGLKYQNERNALPLTYSLGAGYHLPVSGLLLTSNYQHRPLTGDSEFSIGSEYAFVPSLALRAGYAATIGDGNRATGSGFGDSNSRLGGFGTGLGMKVLGSQFDYAFTPMGVLGSTHRITLSTRF